MDEIVTYRQIIKNVLEEYAKLSAADKDIETQLLFDEQHGHYQLLHVGWQHKHRVYGSVMHLDLKDGKVWIQHNGTEADLGKELEDAGISKQDIVLGFRSPAVRAYTGYAVA